MSDHLAERMSDRKVIVSKIDPLGNTAKSFPGQLGYHYTIFQHRDGRQVEVRRGWTSRPWREQVAEAFPGCCMACVGPVEDGELIGPTHEEHKMHSASSRPGFFFRPAELCRECRNLAVVNVARHAVAEYRMFGENLPELLEVVQYAWYRRIHQ